MDPDRYLVHGEAYKKLRERLTELLMQKAGASEFEELHKVCTLKRYQKILACHWYIQFSTSEGKMSRKSQKPFSVTK